MKNKKINNVHELKELHTLEAKRLDIDNEIKEIQSRYDKKEISYDEYNALYDDALDKKDSLYAYTKKEVNNTKVNYLCAGIIVATIIDVAVYVISNRK